MPRKVHLKPSVYAIVQRAVEEGLRGGYYKAHKHTETPDEGHLLEQQEHYIMLALEEVIEFDEP